MTDISKQNIDYDIVAPAAAPMIESMRAHGYSPATAVADIIDNSISAGAKNVWVNFYWNGSDSHISIVDDGSGMTEDVLRAAMRLGSKNPLDERSAQDLGRFGLGLKTASFSQARRLTVASRREGGTLSIRRWDLDHVVGVNDWQLLKRPAESAESIIESFSTARRGTIVLWEIVDRVVERGASPQDRVAHDRFMRMISEVQSYIAMVFHRFLDGQSPLLQVYINGNSEENRIAPWDPFFDSHPATYKTPVETFTHPHGKVSIQGFVLPHKDKLTSDELIHAAGLGGWNQQQGFYIYRNRRMLVGGGWLGLGSDRQWTQEEHYRLARVLVDIPNSQDFDWQIDVKKSTAKPPTWLRDRLKALAEQVRRQAREVFVHRGFYGPRGQTTQITRAWMPRTVNGKPVYRIDRDHPLIKAGSKLAITAEQRKLFDAMIRTMEETVPVSRIWLDAAEQPEAHGRPFETADEIERRRLVEITYRIMREMQGLKPDAARQKLRMTDGFQDLGYLIDEMQG